METGFRKRSCSNKLIERDSDSNKHDRALESSFRNRGLLAGDRMLVMKRNENPANIRVGRMRRRVGQNLVARRHAVEPELAGERRGSARRAVASGRRGYWPDFHSISLQASGHRPRDPGAETTNFVERDRFCLNQSRALSIYLSMIFSENRFPLFGIILLDVQFRAGLLERFQEKWTPGVLKSRPHFPFKFELKPNADARGRLRPRIKSEAFSATMIVGY